MNRKQKIIKKTAKRAKARLNKVENPGTAAAKERYISKAERARLAELEKAEAATEVTAEQE